MLLILYYNLIISSVHPILDSELPLVCVSLSSLLLSHRTLLCRYLVHLKKLDCICKDLNDGKQYSFFIKNKNITVYV